MRSATVRAAIRRGWVCPIMPSTPRPSSRQIFGSWVVSDGRQDLVLALADRQVGRVGQGRYARAAALHPQPRRVDLGGDLVEHLLAGLVIADLADAVEPAPDPAPV